MTEMLGGALGGILDRHRTAPLSGGNSANVSRFHNYVMRVPAKWRSSEYVVCSLNFLAHPQRAFAISRPSASLQTRKNVQAKAGMRLYRTMVGLMHAVHR
jgi:hypothetical protein